MSGKQPTPMEVDDSDNEDLRLRTAVNALVNLKGAPVPTPPLSQEDLTERIRQFYEGRQLMGYDVRRMNPAKIAEKYGATKATQEKLFKDLEKKYPPKVAKTEMYDAVPGDKSGVNYGAMEPWKGATMQDVVKHHPEHFLERLQELREMAQEEGRQEMLALSTAEFTAKSCKQQIDQVTAELRATEEVNARIAADPRFRNPEYVDALGKTTQLMQRELQSGMTATLPGGIGLQMTPEEVRQMMEASVRRRIEGEPGSMAHFNAIIRNLVNGVMANLKKSAAGNTAALIERTMAVVNPIIEQYIPAGSRREMFAQYALTYALWYAQSYIFRLVASAGCWLFFGSGMGGGKRKSRRHRAHKKRKSRKTSKSRKGRKSPKRKVKRGKTHKRKARKGRKSHKRKHSGRGKGSDV